MALNLERVALLLDVATKSSQWPSLNGILGLAVDELEEQSREALKALNEKRKKQEEERQKKITELQAEEEKKAEAAAAQQQHQSGTSYAERRA